MRAVILAGGMGTRLREETEYRPKPMVEVGGRPILWHLMKNLSQQGLNEFVACLGYKGDQIKEYFLKSKVDQWINGGFFNFEPYLFGYLIQDCVLEAEPLEKLVARR